MKRFKGFNGVFSHDMLPRHQLHANTINFGVVNYHRSSQAGSHWVCYFFHPMSTATEFFDSYGLPPSNIIKSYLFNQFSRNIVYNSSRIQSTSSNRCGWYCIYFILARLQGLPFYDIVAKFNGNGSMRNDKTLIKLMRSQDTKKFT